MKSTLYGLLMTASILVSGASAGDQPPPRPTTKPGAWKTDKTICPDQLDMTQLRNLEGGNLDLSGHKFKLSTPQEDFSKMLPGKGQVISEKASVAKIAESKTVHPRAVIAGVDGRHLICKYTFRTASGSVFGKDHNTFSIISVEGRD